MTVKARWEDWCRFYICTMNIELQISLAEHKDFKKLEMAAQQWQDLPTPTSKDA